MGSQVLRRHGRAGIDTCAIHYRHNTSVTPRSYAEAAGRKVAFAMQATSQSATSTTELLNLTVSALRDAIRYIEELAAPAADDAGGREVDPSLALRKRICHDVDLPDWRVVAKHRLRQRLGKGGDRGAAMLLHLMERPGERVSQAELMQTIGMRTQSRNAIKVYICYLRQAFRSFGWTETIIETSQGGYALRRDALGQVLSLLDE